MIYANATAKIEMDDGHIIYDGRAHFTFRASEAPAQDILANPYLAIRPAELMIDFLPSPELLGATATIGYQGRSFCMTINSAQHSDLLRRTRLGLQNLRYSD